MKQKLSQSTIEKLWYYVYLLIDPRDDTVFYIGKWVGNRIYAHVNWTLKSHADTKKNLRIKEIKHQWLDVHHKIIRYGLTEKESFEVEASLIDMVWIDSLTNIVKWHHASERGITTLEQIKIDYESKPINPEEPMVLININNLYTIDMSGDELYQATHKAWRISLERANKCRLACAVYRWITREVYEVQERRDCELHEEWRKEFIGKVADWEIREKYNHKSVSEYWTQWSQNPIKYIG